MLGIVAGCSFSWIQRKRSLDGAKAEERNQHIYQVVDPSLLAVATPMVVMGEQGACWMEAYFQFGG